MANGNNGNGNGKATATISVAAPTVSPSSSPSSSPSFSTTGVAIEQSVDISSFDAQDGLQTHGNEEVSFCVSAYVLSFCVSAYVW